MILAIVLSAIVLFGWTALSERFFRRQGSGRGGGPDAGSSPAGGGARPDSPAAIRARTWCFAKPRGSRSTPQDRRSINLKGARIDDLVLKAYRETVKKDPRRSGCCRPTDRPRLFMPASLTATASTRRGPNTLWTANGQKLTPATPVTLSWDQTAADSASRR